MSPSTLTALADETTVPTSFIRDEEERPKVAYNKFSDEISFISLKGIDESGTRVDHGVDAELISQMTKFAKEFFALPSEEKVRFDMSGGKKGGFIVSSHLQETNLSTCIKKYFKNL
ncbi:hypothetical protein P3S68_017865 [Capsicum galapagoense]